jgi:branched-chain amino acid transport system ATP-binding protein
MVAMMGRSEVGKTTIIRSIMGLTPARAGAICFAGQDVRRLPSFRIAQLGIGLVPEGRQIFRNLTVQLIADLRLLCKTAAILHNLR